ncbi:MAG TPA: hypothetical protein VGG92_22475 [Caulobacteraceae bacterium]|jgi:hypothetical protein
MPDNPMMAKNLFHNLAEIPPCPGKMVGHLSSDQLAALHAFKHEVAAAGFRLYKDVSPKDADTVVRHFLSTMLEKH